MEYEGNADPVRRLSRALLVEGLDDWVMFSELNWIVKQLTGDSSWEAAFGIGIPAIRGLIEDG
ncbi:hypothetical protein FHX37_2815 [Haloactinospora alba]|uniref:Uncharacterized protein n=1 Tax=Haloactinospora alba TaxID=405555 RepID=A0A543NLX1_9ACTN|nr:hypothetical protein [Haloactinospora alba]TQN32831.1 hypothetical protein FHX37_2815 [Haloactinospora alba]